MPHLPTLAEGKACNASEVDVYYYIGERLKLEGETENRGICAKKRISVKAVVLMATPCIGVECNSVMRNLIRSSAPLLLWLLRLRGQTLPKTACTQRNRTRMLAVLKDRAATLMRPDSFQIQATLLNLLSRVCLGSNQE